MGALVAVLALVGLGTAVPARVTYELAGREVPRGRFFVELVSETRLELGDREVRAHFERQVAYRGEPVDPRTHELVAVRLRPPLHAITFPERSYPRRAMVAPEPDLESYRLLQMDVGLAILQPDGTPADPEARRLLEPLWIPLPDRLQDGGPPQRGRMILRPPGAPGPWELRYRVWIPFSGRLDPESLTVTYRFTVTTRMALRSTSVALVGNGRAEWILDGRSGDPRRFDLQISWRPEAEEDPRAQDLTTLTTTWSAHFREPLTVTDLQVRGRMACAALVHATSGWMVEVVRALGFVTWGGLSTPLPAEPSE